MFETSATALCGTTGFSLLSLLSGSWYSLNQVRGQAGRTVLMYAAECGLDDVAWLASQTVSESGWNTTACLFQCDSCKMF